MRYLAQVYIGKEDDPALGKLLGSFEVEAANNVQARNRGGEAFLSATASKDVPSFYFVVAKPIE